MNRFRRSSNVRKVIPDTQPLAAHAPAWSGKLTTPLAAVIPRGWRAAALTSIRAIHTAIFALRTPSVVQE
jgi:hypothetical protein